VNVFKFREELIKDYESFSRSFTRIRARDIQAFADRTYDSGHFWPDPLIQLNPSFAPGRTVKQLVGDGVLHRECAAIFRTDKAKGNPGKSIRLHQHQEEAVLTAQHGESYVLTTGTGSGKSLSYFIPIVDAVLKERGAGGARGPIRAIVVYPMNALCNSQREELKKFLFAGYGEGSEPVSFGRYTGQENSEERERLANNPPDILLTNFMMLELLITRQDDLDRSIIKAASGLRFLVLDELHTYRGRQGADVALLVRRVRERLNPALLCIGTSATMASEGDAASRREVVVSVATKLFGAQVTAANVITETLRRVTPERTQFDASELKAAIEQDLLQVPDYEALRSHILASWVESRLGLAYEEGKWVRAKPISLKDAAEALARESGTDPALCVERLKHFLLLAYNTRDASNRSLFAFRLHQFISGAGSLFATLEPEGSRYLTVFGQQYMPGDRDRRLFNAVFCRECGQEYFPVWATAPSGVLQAIEPRELGDVAQEDEDQRWGYFMPDPTRQWVPEDLERAFPEGWLEIRRDELAVKPWARRNMPRAMMSWGIGSTMTCAAVGGSQTQTSNSSAFCGSTT
jgi:Distinct helicase family with a unique C-terminal domain including a metal-binding cysteine cluster